MSEVRIVRSNERSLHVTFSLADPTIPLLSLVKVTADRTVGIAGPGDTPLGVLISTTPSGKGGVGVPYNKEMKVQLAGAVVAGDFAKVGTNGTSGEQRFTKFDPVTDEEELKCGMFIEGGDENAFVSILI